MSGRHRGAGYLNTPARAAVVIVALVAGTGALILWQSSGGSGCTAEVRLRVAAAPEIATAVRQTADEWAAGARAPGGQCVRVDVAPVGSADVAVAVATNGGVALTGLTRKAAAASPAPSPGSASPGSASPGSASPGLASGAPGSPAPSGSGAGAAVTVPDVWIPDSSTWLVRVRAAGPNLVPPQAPSIARSPVVLAMPEPIAATLGWPGSVLTWNTLLQRMNIGQGLKVGIVEPNRDAAGLAGLVALGSAAAATGTAAEQTTVAVMRALVLGRANVAADLFAHFPKTADPAAMAAGLSAAPLSEQQVIAYNQTSPAVKLAGFYVDPVPPALDYPYAVMPGISADRSSLADELRAALSGSAYADRLSAAGLRDQDGAGSGRGFPVLPGAPVKAVAGQLDGATVSKALATWIEVTKPARMLAVFDISGSMGLPVPSVGGATRCQVAVAAAQKAMALFDDSWAVGLWTFSTLLDGDKDYKELLPIGSVGKQRAQLLSALAAIAPIPNGQTGLYDTVLAAYKTAQAGWDPDSVNSVVLLTDGQNQDSTGLTLDQLIDQLKAIIDPRHPIQVIAIGIGDDVSQAELERITSTTGGGTFIARDPSAIGPIFIKAISLRPGLPA